MEVRIVQLQGKLKTVEIDGVATKKRGKYNIFPVTGYRRFPLTVNSGRAP